MNLQGEYMCVACVEYEDGSLGANPLHCGDLESCEDAADLIDAISITPAEGKRPVGSFVSIIKTADWVRELENQKRDGQT